MAALKCLIEFDVAITHFLLRSCMCQNGSLQFPKSPSGCIFCLVRPYFSSQLHKGQTSLLITMIFRNMADTPLFLWCCQLVWKIALKIHSFLSRKSGSHWVLIFLSMGFQSTDELSFFSVKKIINLLRRAMRKTIFDVFALSNAGSGVVFTSPGPGKKMKLWLKVSSS